MPSKPEEIVEVYRRAITPRTRVISMCHVVNTNGIRVSLSIFNSEDQVDRLVGGMRELG